MRLQAGFIAENALLTCVLQYSTLLLMSKDATHPDIAAIDAALSRGAWWVRLFNELSQRGMRRAEALEVESRKGLRRAIDDFDRIARAVRLAVVAAMRLRGFLMGLAQLRSRTPADLAAARAHAKAKAEEDAAARQAGRDKAKARRQARAVEVRERVIEAIERDKPALRDRDPLIEALDRRLAVGLALVDLDDLPLRETVMRICADLGITPDWSRWETGDWTTSDPLAWPTPEPRPKPSTALWKPAPPPKVLAPLVLRDLPGLLARRTDTAISLVLQVGSFVPPWLPPRPG